MKGASGASLKLSGDTVKKVCKDSSQQVQWFQQTQKFGLPQGLRVPRVFHATDTDYEMEYIQGHEATHEATLFGIKACWEWCLHAKQKPSKSTATWDDYLARLEDHVKLANTAPMNAALHCVAVQRPLAPTFNHGDLTLENVLITPDSVTLIDPNFSPSLFQSYILDLGKLMQSTHFNYHKVFNSNHGVNLMRHSRWLEVKLKQNGLWEASSLACLSHIIRLRKYQPLHLRPLVDQHLDAFIKNYT